MGGTNPPEKTSILLHTKPNLSGPDAIAAIAKYSAMKRMAGSPLVGDLATGLNRDLVGKRPDSKESNESAEERLNRIRNCTELLLGALRNYARVAKAKPTENESPDVVGWMRGAYVDAAETLANSMRHAFCCQACTVVNAPASKECVSCGNDLHSSLTEEEDKLLALFVNPYPFISHKLSPIAAELVLEIMTPAAQRAMELAANPKMMKIINALRQDIESFSRIVRSGASEDDLHFALKATQKSYEFALFDLSHIVSTISCKCCGLSQPNLFDSCSQCGVDFNRHGRRRLVGSDHVAITALKNANREYARALTEFANLIVHDSCPKCGEGNPEKHSFCETAECETDLSRMRGTINVMIARNKVGLSTLGFLA